MRLPRDKEQFGVIMYKLGGSRYRCISEKNNTMIVKPRSYLRWKRVKVGDIVLIEPWIVQKTERGHITYVYTQIDTYHLKNENLLPSVIVDML